MMGHVDWGRVVAWIVFLLVTTIVILVGAFVEWEDRQRRENLLWRAHMAGDHKACLGVWACKVPGPGDGWGKAGTQC